MAIDLNQIRRQFSGRKVAELVLEHMKRAGAAENMLAIKGAIEELRLPVSSLVEKFVDSQFKLKPQIEVFAALNDDLGNRFPLMIEATKEFMRANQVTLADDEAFDVFNILILVYAQNGHVIPALRRAIEKMVAAPL